MSPHGVPQARYNNVTPSLVDTASHPAPQRHAEVTPTSFLPPNGTDSRKRADDDDDDDDDDDEVMLLLLMMMMMMVVMVMMLLVFTVRMMMMVVPMAMIKIVIGQLKLVAVLEGKPSQVPSRKKIKAKERRETMNVRKKPNTIEAEKVRTTPTIGKAREVSVRERGGERDDWRFFIFIIFHPENVPIASCWASAKPTIHVVRQTEK